uniref:T cell receptor delta variable 3 n=1 Tax=Oryctolagus cuniculus TaxID=9986 RepID=G1TZ37_RABIT
MILSLGFSLLLLYQGVQCITVTQSPSEQTVASGRETILLCTYDVDFSDPDLYWYRRRPDHSFEFLLYRDDSRSQDADFVQGRFSVKRSQTQKTFHLVISAVRPEDSAVYYCAVSTVIQMLRKPAHKPLGSAELG